MQINLNGSPYHINAAAPFQVNQAVDSNSNEIFYYLSGSDDINCILSMIPNPCPAVFDQVTANDLLVYLNGL